MRAQVKSVGIVEVGGGESAKQLAHRLASHDVVVTNLRAGLGRTR